MKRIARAKPHQSPGPDYQFTLNDLQRMVEQLGGRLHLDIYPKEFDDDRLRLDAEIRLQIARERSKGGPSSPEEP